MVLRRMKLFNSRLSELYVVYLLSQQLQMDSLFRGLSGGINIMAVVHGNAMLAGLGIIAQTQIGERAQKKICKISSRS